MMNFIIQTLRRANSSFAFGHRDGEVPESRSNLQPPDACRDLDLLDADIIKGDLTNAAGQRSPNAEGPSGSGDPLMDQDLHSSNKSIKLLSI